MYRWSELVRGVHWRSGQTGDSALRRLAAPSRAQGFDWQGHLQDVPVHHHLDPDECGLSGHGPDNAMAIKIPAVWYFQSDDLDDLAAADQIIGELDRWHVQATGMFSCSRTRSRPEPAHCC